MRSSEIPMAPATGVSEPVCGSAAAPEDSVIAAGLLLWGFPLCSVLIEVLGEALWLVLIEVLGEALRLVLIEVLGEALRLVLIDVLGEALRLVLIDVLGEALLLVLIDVLGLGDGLWLSPGPHTMMWLIALSPFLPPGSKIPLPLVSAHTVSPDEALANKVLV